MQQILRFEQTSSEYGPNRPENVQDRSGGQASVHENMIEKQVQVLRFEQIYASEFGPNCPHRVLIFATVDDVQDGSGCQGCGHENKVEEQVQTLRFQQIEASEYGPKTGHIWCRFSHR